jgi:DNA-binding transcriptional LysR family regulator
MDLKKLEQFLAVYEHRNYARAAEALGLSQPAITKSILALEKELDVRLFERGQFGATPTEFAVALEKRARLMLSESHFIVEELNGLKGASAGALKIGVGISFVPRLIPLIIDRFKSRWPDVEVYCETGFSAALYPRVSRGEFDLALSAPTNNLTIQDDLTVEPLFVETDLVTIRKEHPLASKTGDVTGKDLVGLEWAVSRDAGIWQIICDYFVQQGLPVPKQKFFTNSSSLGKELINQCGFVGLIGEELSANEVKEGKVVAHFVDGLSTQRVAYICRRRRSPQKVAAQNMSFIIRQVCSEVFGELYLGAKPE